MEQESETNESVWEIDPVAGKISGPFPLVFPADNRYFKRMAMLLAVIAGLAIWAYVADTSLWPIGILAMVLVLCSGGVFFAARRKLLLHLDETGFRVVGSLRGSQVIQWNEVTEFSVISLGGNRLIAYNFIEPSRRRRLPGGVALGITRFAGLPVDAVAAVMESCRRQFSVAE